MGADLDDPARVGEPAPTVPEGLAPPAPPSSLELVSEWDSALTYDGLEEEDDPDGFDRGVFVGRRELLGPLVNAICNPDRRGTYLISGYRGAGKTSLVIQAAKDAKPLLEQRGFHLLPLVLNVSEVSASLTAASDADAPPLGIDARRLLTALIRALRNGLTAQAHERDLGSVRQLVDHAYEKAEASSYAEKSSLRREMSAARKVESSRSFDVANVFKLVAVLAALGAVAVEGVAMLGTSLAALQVPVVALAGVAVFSFHRSTVTTHSSSEDADSAVELSFDNSLHQVETDLKEILSRLCRGQQLRMIFVLEELDKVDDADGTQLDAVIRYFKNLFTQAPALFFFLTDKSYLDQIDKKIVASRRSGSYAVEHTFFTHRVFVGRPSLDECLEYFLRVLAGPMPDVRIALDEIRESQTSRARPLEAMSPIERFLRVLLFVSQNHLFDLKDEMRGYLHTGEDGSRLEFGGGAFPEGLAAFHFLLEQKMRLFGFGASRQYTGEVLRNSLSAVFTELGTSAVQSVEDLTAEQEAGLDWTERKRIRDAVQSLLDDLARGGAISIDAAAGSGEGTSFVWRPSAEVVFSPAPQLEAHEKAFVEQLERALRVCRQFGPDGPLRDVGDEASALSVIERYRDMAKEVNAAQEPLSAEETQRRSRALTHALTSLLSVARQNHQFRLQQRDWVLIPMSSDGSIVVVNRVGDKDPASVLLVYDPAEIDSGVLQSIYASMPPTGSAVVLVDDDPEPGPGARRALIDRWRGYFVGVSNPPSLLTVVALGEQLPAPAAVAQTWGERSSDELALARLCARGLAYAVETMPAPPTQGPVWLTSSGGPEIRYEGMADAITAWLESGDRILGIPFDTTDLNTVVAAFAEAVRDLDLPPVLWVPLPDELDPDVRRRLQHGNRLINLCGPGATVPTLGRTIIVDTAVSPVVRSERWSVLRTGETAEVTAALARFLEPVDADFAGTLFQTAAESGDPAAIGLALLHASLTGDIATANRWLEALISTGDREAILQAANQVSDGDVAQRLRAAVDSGSASATPATEN